ncbi:outer membrane protein Iml2/Tetratricopeptide repeat protein 39 [Geopyxis carbonaria]|nr:outer membrane protein Iml2/Tetratricopeptide repeat protein 39 [Geopyxis carbonaria]
MALYDALKAMDMLMDDAINDAEKSLEKGNSSFHKLAMGVIAFLQASLGFESDVMREASDRLADAETSADRDRRKAVKENRQGGTLPPGFEFAVCHVEAQLMSAVVGLLSESLVDTMKSFYKLRAAYKSLETLYITISTLESSKQTISDSHVSSAERLSNNLENGDNYMEIQYNKQSDISTTIKNPRPGTSSSRNLSKQSLEDFSASGCYLCFGLLLLLVSLVPPSLARVMTIVGFKGDRERGLELLWKAAETENVHGAIATLALLQYYGNAVQFCDIIPADNERGGYPKERCQNALARMRRRYPNSALWRLEEARIESVYGSVGVAVDMLSVPFKTEMRQVEALILFEKSINCMFLHRYDAVAEGFLHLTTMNKWSHGLYHYFAAACNIEQYRYFKEIDIEKSIQYAEKAEELLNLVPTFMGKRRFMAQNLPLEVFADRKIKKWRARAISRNCRLIDGVGVSPLEEMIYIWNGYRKMHQENFDISLKALDYSKNEEDPDEQAIRWLLMAVVHRRMGKLQEAKSMLERVIPLEKHSLTGLHHDEWMIPTACYEKAVLLWTEFGPGEKNQDIVAWLNKGGSWGPYELDTRVGMKIQTALDSMKWYTGVQ